MATPTPRYEVLWRDRDDVQSKRRYEDHVAMVRFVREAIADGRIESPDGRISGWSPDRYCIEARRQGWTARTVYDRLQQFQPLDIVNAD